MRDERAATGDGPRLLALADVIRLAVNLARLTQARFLAYDAEKMVR